MVTSPGERNAASGPRDCRPANRAGDGGAAVVGEVEEEVWRAASLASIWDSIVSVFWRGGGSAGREERGKRTQSGKRCVKMRPKLAFRSVSQVWGRKKGGGG